MEETLTGFRRDWITEDKKKKGTSKYNRAVRGMNIVREVLAGIMFPADGEIRI